MKAWRVIGVLSLIICFAGLTTYSITVSVRMARLEKRLKETEERLRAVERERLRAYPLQGLQSLEQHLKERRNATSGAKPDREFLYDGIRPHDTVAPWRDPASKH